MAARRKRTEATHVSELAPIARLGIDVDGVLADFGRPLISAVTTRFTFDDLRVWDFFSRFTKAEKKVIDELLEQPDFWRDQPVIAGAKEGIRKLRAAGYELLFITSPWGACREWERVRQEWLHAHFDVSSKDVIPISRKEVVYVDMLVDDRPQNLYDYHKAWPNARTYIFDQPYNQEVGAPHIRWTWDNIPILKDR